MHTTAPSWPRMVATGATIIAEHWSLRRRGAPRRGASPKAP
ncbi:hypothetical protein [Humibacter ginsengisoli]